MSNSMAKTPTFVMNADQYHAQLGASQPRPQAGRAGSFTPEHLEAEFPDPPGADVIAVARATSAAWYVGVIVLTALASGALVQASDRPPSKAVVASVTVLPVGLILAAVWL
jgi:hypothetical protein